MIHPGRLSRKSPLLLAAVIVAAALPRISSAAILTWDPQKQPASPLDGSSGGLTNWDNATRIWSTLSDPSGQSPNSPADVAWSTNTTGTAVFGNGGGTTTGSGNTNYSVTISSSGVSVGGITFAPLAVATDGTHGSDYQISGGPIILNQPTTTITVNNAHSPDLTSIPDAEISSQITGHNNLVITGPGALDIGNTSTTTPNNYVGTTTIYTDVYLGSVDKNNRPSNTTVTAAFGAVNNSVVLSNASIVNKGSGGKVLTLLYNFNVTPNTTNSIVGTTNGSTSLGNNSSLTHGSVAGSGSLTFNLGNYSSFNSVYANFSTFAGTFVVNGGGMLHVYAKDGAFTGSSAMTLDVESTDTAATIFSPQTNSGGDTFSFGSLTSATATSVLTGGTAGSTNSGMATFVVGALGANSTFAGIIGTAGNPYAALTKVGTGSLTLTNSNFYVGPTTVSGGTLIVNGAITNSTATVEANGTLAGIGTISLPAIDNGTLNPGDSGTGSIGNLSFGSDLALGATATYAADFNASAADVLAVGGNLSLATGDALVLTPTDGTTTGTFVIATYAGALTGTFTNVPANVTVDYGSGNHSSITVTVTPEPASLGVLSFGAMMLIGRRRRSR